MARRKPLCVSNVEDVARHFGVATSRIYDWFAHGCPCKGGPYDLYLIHRWRWGQRDDGAEQPKKKAEDELKLRKMELQIRADELDYAERVGKLLPREDVDLIFKMTAKELRQLGEVLQQRFGDDAQRALLDRLDNVQRIVTKELKTKK